MDQERADYADHPTAKRRPWTLAQIAIVILVVRISVPLAFAVLIGVVVGLSLQH